MHNTLAVLKGKLPIWDLLAWWSVVAALPLPALSYLGYPILSLEYLGSVVVVGGFAALIWIISGAIRWMGIVVLVILLETMVGLYFAQVLFPSTSAAIAASLGLGVFVSVGIFRFPDALRVAGIASAAQVIGVGLASVPSATTEVRGGTAHLGSLPTVIHLVMDELGGTGAYPEGIIFQRERDAMEAHYVKLGFTVFRNAYSADRSTHLSIARLLNIGDNPMEMLRRDSLNNWELTRASVLTRLSAERLLDIETFDYLRFGSEVQQSANISYLKVRAAAIGYPSFIEVGLSFKNRMIVAHASGLYFLLSLTHRPRLAQWLSRYRAGRIFVERLEPLRRAVHPLASQAYFRRFIEYLECCGARGTYYYRHYLIPHFPYVFRSDCTVRPAGDWLNTRSVEYEAADPFAAYIRRYRAYFSQSKCVARGVSELVGILEKAPRLKDAIILIHGDHGSRIVFERNDGIGSSGHSTKNDQRDLRGAFFAVRIPGITGGVVERAGRIDLLYREFALKRFRVIQADTVPMTNDSPY